MSKLGWTAIGGFAVGFVGLGLTMALGAEEWRRFRLDDFLSSAACEPDTDGVGAPNGEERRWTWTGGDAVVIAVPGTVHYRGGEGNEVIVRGPADLVSRVRVRGDEIKLCKGAARGSGLDITLPGRPFKSMAVAGSTDMTLENVTTSDLKIAVAGSGKLRAQGRSDKVDLVIAGSGDADLSELDMEKLKLNIAGSGHVDAGPKDTLDLNIAGSGRLRLLNKPSHVESSIVGSGKIVQVADGETKSGD